LRHDHNAIVASDNTGKGTIHFGPRGLTAGKKQLEEG
jgi:hypothetical protein